MPLLPSFITPPTWHFCISFPSVIPLFPRRAASTATEFSASHFPRFFTTSPRACARGAKPKKMPPKKAVVEEKVHLGRPGNSLKSGIVCQNPSPPSRHVLTLTVDVRSALRTSANRRCSKPSQNAILVTLP